MSIKDNSWPRGIFIFYVVFMIVLVGAVIFSTRNNVELVTINYYEKTLTYENQIQAIKNVNALDKKPIVAIEKSQMRIILVMPENFNPDTIQGKILFFRPSDMHFDISFDLKCNSQNQQIFPLEKMAKGKWRIKMDWTDGSKEYYFEQVIFI